MSVTLEPSDDDFKLVDISELPMEKQFAVHSFEKDVDKMSLEQARYFLKAFRRQEELKFHVLKGVVKKDGL
jgi:hypothetical protein